MFLPWFFPPPFPPYTYRIEAIENIEEALTGLKVIDFEENTIKVSLKTYIPEGVMCQLNAEDYIKQSEVNHELLIEVVNGTMDLKNVEVQPYKPFHHFNSGSAVFLLDTEKISFSLIITLLMCKIVLELQMSRDSQ